jgi:23S rRNA (cytidine1920-2'-O)/16S rRNA (cytidine1409-2'-O)-methyltransferase
VCLDSGLSTGGFTDCMLQRGAAKVYGVDVGYGQVAEKIRVHPKAVVMERTNLRYLQPLPDPIDVAALDLSFISVLKVLPAVAATMRNDGSGKLIVLIKPQFEARRSQIGAKGVVRDPAVNEEVIANVVEGAKALGFVYQSHTVSPIKGAKEGNTEFLAYFTRDETHVPPPPEKPSPS